MCQKHLMDFLKSGKSVFIIQIIGFSQISMGKKIKDLKQQNLVEIEYLLKANLSLILLQAFTVTTE